MKYLFSKLACIAFGTCAFATAAIAQTPVSPPGSWPFAITTPGSYRLTANMLAPAASSAILITSNNVTLDLNGFTVSQSGLVTLCNPDTTTGYGSTCVAAGGPVLISASGRNITIKNGTVYNGPGGGISLSVGIPIEAMYGTFEDLRVIGNRGAGISASGDGNRFIRVDASYNAGHGIISGTDAHLESVSASWNDGYGVSASAYNISSRVIARANGQTGLYASGIVDKVLVRENNGEGIVVAGVLRNVFSDDNGFDDVGTGILLDSNFNTGTVYTSGCYAQTRAGGFAGSGVPMTSNTCP
ncbi:MAG: hypothetical protein DI564_13895 [Rhodanobacter denitrificans]|uniref:Right handed beta helix domain-containing protein n=1 Tax=Rhodanobacter denitrificans TaxID=666685 RepID=A0A2W5K404_9GAMM|nr:MAG: hypothetical protein DI564_13895 [Rhodanobacter denitrificans]